MGEPHGGNCEELFEAVHALVDGEASDAGRDELLSHMEGCAACRGYFESARATRGALGSLGRGAACAEEERATLDACLREVLRRMGR